MGRVLVAHHYWNQAGGGTYVAARVAKVLLDSGYDVALMSIFRVDLDGVRRVFGVDLSGVKVYSLKMSMPRILGIYQRVLFPNILSRAVKVFRPDIIFLDEETYKPVLKHRARMGFRIIEYIHFPYLLLSYRDALYKKYASDPEALRYLAEAEDYHVKYRSGLWRLYFSLYLRLYRRVARENPFEAADAVLANSRYVARLVKLLWGEEPLVVYPPVRVSDFRGASSRGFDERDNAIVMIGRITTEKRIEDVVRAIAASEAKPTLRVVGGLLPANIPYKERVERLAGRLGVRVEFYPNAPRRELVRLAASSKLLVHATVGEHFGIAVVEGMAAGCPVIVHRGSGTYDDVLEGGRYGLGYSSIEELSDLIDKLLADEKLWRRYHELSLRRAEEFSEERFDKQIMSVISSL